MVLHLITISVRILPWITLCRVFTLLLINVMEYPVSWGLLLDGVCRWHNILMLPLIKCQFHGFDQSVLNSPPKAQIESMYENWLQNAGHQQHHISIERILPPHLRLNLLKNKCVRPFSSHNEQMHASIVTHLMMMGHCVCSPKPLLDQLHSFTASRD